MPLQLEDFQMSSTLSESKQILAAFALGTAVAFSALHAYSLYSKDTVVPSGDIFKNPTESKGCPFAAQENLENPSGGGGCPMAQGLNGMSDAKLTIVSDSQYGDFEKISDGNNYSLDGNNPKNKFQSSSAKNFDLSTWIANNGRLIQLYEDFLNIEPIRNCWKDAEREGINSDIIAAFHGIESCFLLLAEFISDSRTYISKDIRIECIVKDLAFQTNVLVVMQTSFQSAFTDIAELPEPRGRTYSKDKGVNTLSLRELEPWQEQSTGLKMLTDQIKLHYDSCVEMEQWSIRSMVLSIYSEFRTLSMKYNMNMGVEYQLRELIHVIGFEQLYNDSYSWSMNAGNRPVFKYAQVIKPKVVANTRVNIQFEHPEDFFFRTIHVGTECWGKVAMSLLSKSYQLAENGSWKDAAYSVELVCDILNYLGNHVLSLTSMNLRDFLVYKVCVYI